MKFLTLIFTVLLFVGCSSNEHNSTTQSENILSLTETSVTTSDLFFKNKEGGRWKFLKKNYYVASKASETFGIPISIILANVAYEYRESEETFLWKTNNHFWIKAFNERTPHTLYHNIKIRTYKSLWEGYSDHSLQFLREYSGKTNGLNRTDYLGWIKMFKSNTDSTLHSKYFGEHIEEIITKLQLYELDRL